MVRDPATNWTWEELSKTWIGIEYFVSIPDPNSCFPYVPRIYEFFMNPSAFWTSGDTLPFVVTLIDEPFSKIELSEARIVKGIPFLGGLSIKGGRLHAVTDPDDGSLSYPLHHRIPRGVGPGNPIDYASDGQLPPGTPFFEGGDPLAQTDLEPGLDSWLYGGSHFLGEVGSEYYYPPDIPRLFGRGHIYRDIIFRAKITHL